MTTTTNKAVRIAVFASGNGTNCENLIRRCRDAGDAEVALVVTNRGGAGVVERASRLGVPLELITKDGFSDESRVMSVLRSYGIDFIVLAGFLLMVPPYLVEAYEGRMVNIHPSLLPRHGGRGMYGRRVHEAVKECGDATTGITVHWVNRRYDEGGVIARFSVGVTSDDSVDDIERKVRRLEAAHYPDVVLGLVRRMREASDEAGEAGA